MEFQNEKIKRIPEYPDYAISDLGRVFSYKGKKKIRKILKQGSTTQGYLKVALVSNGKCKYKYIHQLVYETFTGKKSNKKYHIHHKNHIKRDNRLENLELVTTRYNSTERKERFKSKTGYTGVGKTRNGKLQLHLKFNKKQWLLGTYLYGSTTQFRRKEAIETINYYRDNWLFDNKLLRNYYQLQVNIDLLLQESIRQLLKKQKTKRRNPKFKEFNEAVREYYLQ